MAHDAGIPVLAYDRLITDCDLDLYMTFDNVKVGELQAQFLVDRLAEGGPEEDRPNLWRRRPTTTRCSSSRDRTTFSGRSSTAGEFEIVHEDWTQDWKPENAKKIANAAITKAGPNFDAILASNDGTAGGAIQALTEEGLAGKIFVTGQDAELGACQRIVDGTQAMTIYKPLSQLAKQAAEARHEDGPRQTGRRPGQNRQWKNRCAVRSCSSRDLVTKENMMDTVIKDGFHTAAKFIPAHHRSKRRPGERE